MKAKIVKKESSANHAVSDGRLAQTLLIYHFQHNTQLLSLTSNH